MEETMPVSRRGFLKAAGAGLGALALNAAPVSAKSTPKTADNSASMLYDSTICVGCRACQTACKARAKLPYRTDAQSLYEAPTDLNADTWTIIKLYKGDEGTAFVKNQCMHCIEPACVSVCPVAALQKTESGPVIYLGERCIGCRYCMAACPFNIPKTQWEKVLPLIQKCDFCADRQAKGEVPACGEVCPTGALIYGTRKQMLDTAKARLQDSQRYYQHIYGETEAGGTSMLYIAGLEPEKLGLHWVSDQVLPELDWPYLAAVPWEILAVVGLSTAIYLRTHRNEGKNGRPAPKKEKEG
jgi:Fe-S-cluster-containing dehydrogenase component